MAFNFCRSSVKVAVAQICRSLGWSAVHTTPLEILVDLMERYIVSLAKNTQKYAEQVGRADASSGDLLLALADVNALLPELLEYMKNVDPVEFPKKVPAFPVPKPCKLIYCADTDESEAAEFGRDSQNFNPVAESVANGAPGAQRKSAATLSPDKAGQPRPLQELGNDAFRESLRMLLESDDTDIEEKLGKAPDRRPPVQMAQIMRQRRPVPMVQPISITGVTSNTPVVTVTTPDNAGTGEAVPATVRLSGPEPQVPKKKRERSSSGTAPGQPGDGPPPKRSKTGKTGGSSGGGDSSGKGHDNSAKASTISSKSADTKRREKAAVAKQRKRDQNYSALAEALTAAPLQVPPAAALVSAERRAGSSTPASRSSSKHAAAPAGTADLAMPSVVASSSSSSSSTVQAGQSKGPQRGQTASASLTAVHLQHLEDTFDAVIRGTDSSRRQDRAAARAETVVAESDEDEEIDVEDLNQSHDQLASPPRHLLPLSTAAFAATSIGTQLSPPPPPPPPRTSRSTIDDIIDSVARGEDLEAVADGSNDDNSRPDVPAAGVKVLESRKGDRKKHKKKKSKTRSKPPSQPLRSPADVDESATAVDSEQLNDHRQSRTGRAASEAAAVSTASAASPPLRIDSPAAGDQLVPEPEYQDRADDEMAVDEPGVVDVVDEDIEVVHEVEVEIDEPQGELPGSDAAGSSSPSAAAGLPSPTENFCAPSIEEYHVATATVHGDLDEAEPQQLPASPQQTQEEVGMVVASDVEKRKEKHKKEKKEKKKKKNKERHREKPDDDDDDAVAGRSSASKLHKEHHRHKHHHHHSRGEAGSGKTCDDVEKKRERSTEHRHRTKDKSTPAGGGDAAKPRHQVPVEAVPAVTTASVPKLLFKIAGRTISTVSSGDDGAGGPSAISASSGKQGSSAPQAVALPRAAPPRTKATEIYTETEFTGGTRETVDVVQEEEDSKVWICPTCQLPDDGTPMIGCDKCEEWYHWICVGVVTEPPEDAKWFCPRCRTKKPPKKKAKH